MFVCNFLCVPRCQGQIAPQKTHSLSCFTRNFRDMLTPIQVICNRFFQGIWRTELVPNFVDEVSSHILSTCQRGAGSPSLSDIWQH